MIEPDPSDIASLLGDLASATPEVRHRAVWALGESGRPEVIDALVAATRDRDHMVRWASVRSLVRFSHDDRAVRALVEWLEREESVFSLFETLVEMKAAVAPQLVKRLCADNERTRWRAAVWLARLGDAAGADTLAAFLEAHDSVPRFEAALVLTNLGKPVASNYDPDSLVEAVQVDGGSVRAAAAWALGLIGDSRALHILLPLVMHGHDAASIVPALERSLLRDLRGEASVPWRAGPED